MNEIELGPCCACEGLEHVRNVVMLDKKSTEPGTGWGCVVCHLPNDGAIAVLCDGCLELHAVIRFAVVGWVTDKKRVPIDALTEEHKHNMYFHFDEMLTG